MEKVLYLLMNAKTITALLAVVGAVSVLLTQVQPDMNRSEFAVWKAKYNIHFESQFEEAYRERVFLENLAKVNEHNAKNDVTYTLGINQFSAMTQEEFVQTYLGTVVEERTPIVGQMIDPINADIDWSNKGVLN